VLSLGVFVGGLLWSWLLRRHGSLVPGYLSHILVDLAIFVVGASMLFGS
jgi:membrane protease YdiL (CAAX protease family)